MKIRLGMETVTAANDGGISLSLLRNIPNIYIPPVLSIEATSLVFKKFDH